MGEPVSLKWHGPLKMGNLPDTKEAIRDLSFSAVYIFFRCYQGGRTLVYIGKTGNLIDRLARHYGDFLSTLVGTLFRSDGSEFRAGGRPEYFRSIQSDALDEIFSYAKADAYRTRFIFTRLSTDQIDAIEATIIARLKASLPDEFFELWNTGHRSSLVLDRPIQHDMSALEVDLFAGREWGQLSLILSCAQ